VTERDKAIRNLEIIKRECERDPEDAFTWFNLGMTEHIMQNHWPAVEALERMREIVRNQGPKGFIPNGLCALCDTYTERLNLPEKALPIALECLEYSPRYANAHFSLGKAYFALRQFGKAREAYEAAIADGEFNERQFVVDDDVSRWKSYSEIGSTYVEEGDFEKALEWFQKGAKNTAAQPIRLNLARTLERVGRLTEAGEVFRKLYDEFGDEQSILNYINYLLRRGMNAAALRLIDASIDSVRSGSAVDMLVAAAKVARTSQLADAETYLLRAREISPGNAEVLTILETVYQEQGETEKLNALWESELDTPCTTVADYTRRSYRRIARGEFDKALQVALAGLELAPDDPMLAYNAAAASANLARRDDALSFLARISSSGEKVYAQARMLEVTLLRDGGRNAEALRAADAFVKCQPENVEAALVKAQLLEHLGRVDDAEAALRNAWHVDKRRVAVDLASLYLRQGRVADAQRTAADALA
ncbi:MAG: tetratricopeptide repeat protein, partial [Candidatus Eremiobacteraeota bacterium]|nr:tetratricopeptide repeat protein [Candidatus Eremiobacteraeota bacterium]